MNKINKKNIIFILVFLIITVMFLLFLFLNRKEIIFSNTFITKEQTNEKIIQSNQEVNQIEISSDIQNPKIEINPMKENNVRPQPTKTKQNIELEIQNKKAHILYSGKSTYKNSEIEELERILIQSKQN